MGCSSHPTLYNRFVYIRTGFINTTEVEKAVDEFLKTLGPEVVRVRYNIGEDWMGDPALYFRVVLSDSVSENAEAFVATAERVNRSSSRSCSLLKTGDCFLTLTFAATANRSNSKIPSGPEALEWLTTMSCFSWPRIHPSESDYAGPSPARSVDRHICSFFTCLLAKRR